jgi:phage-related protein
MYITISTIWRHITNNLQPILMFIKAGLMMAVIPILKVVEVVIGIVASVLQFLAGLIAKIYHVLGDAFSMIGKALSKVAASIPGWADPTGILGGVVTAIADASTAIGGQMEEMGDTLDGIHDMVKEETKGKNVNAWAVDTLNALAIGAGASAVHGTRSRSATGRGATKVNP